MIEKLKSQNSKIKTTSNKLKLYVLSLGITLCTLQFTLLVIQPVYALDSSPSADIRLKLEELKKEIASKAALLKQEMNQKLKDKAYVGKVKLKSGNSLTLAADSGPKVININQDTVFDSFKLKTKFSQKTLSLEDYVAALGDTDETGVLTAKKIILLSATEQTKIYLWGQVISISDNLITLKTNASKNIAAVLSAQNIKLKDFVIMTGRFDKNDIFAGEFAYVIPQGNILKPKKISTSSAQTATASAKPISR